MQSSPVIASSQKINIFTPYLSQLLSFTSQQSLFSSLSILVFITHSHSLRLPPVTRLVPGEVSVIAWHCIVLLFSPTFCSHDKIFWPWWNCVASCGSFYDCLQAQWGSWSAGEPSVFYGAELWEQQKTETILYEHGNLNLPAYAGIRHIWKSTGTLPRCVKLFRLRLPLDFHLKLS